MKRYRKYLIGVGLVALWGIFSYAYLGVEDGSSGLRPLGWLASAEQGQTYTFHRWGGTCRVLSPTEGHGCFED